MTVRPDLLFARLRRDPSLPDGPKRPGERGFALLATLLILVGLTGLATAGMMMSHDEYEASWNHDSAVDAFYVAQSGLSRYLADSQGTNPDTVVYDFGGGSATVWKESLLDVDGQSRVYRVVSVGTTDPDRGGQATRRLEAVAINSSFNLKVPAALTAAGGLVKNGSAGVISGTDACGAKADVAGVAVPPGGYTQTTSDTVPTGSPRVDDSQTSQQLLQATGIDWHGIRSGNAIQPTYTLPTDSWPNFDALSSGSWPIIYADEDNLSVGQSNSGRGTLIVRGNLDMQGDFKWDGIILVGGTMTSDGYQEINGGMVTGLNMLLGQSVAQSDIGNGTKQFHFHSCNVTSAEQQWASLVLEPGSLRETM